MSKTNIIEELREAQPDERANIITRLYEKNRAFFKKKLPIVHDFIERTECPYHFDLTESFLNIVHTPTGQLAHPEAGVDLLAEMLGDWTHDNWLDFQNISVPVPVENFQIHRSAIDDLYKTLHDALPSFSKRFQSKHLYLQDAGVDRKFSTPVAFVGIFHGLHIDYYLSRTELDSVLLIEPEPERFEVSCYFLDYEEIENRFGRLYLVIDSSPDNEALRNFFLYGRVTPMVWLRVLPGYVSDTIGPIVATLRLLQQVNRDMFIPIDIDLEALENGGKNLKRNLPLLTSLPRLSKNSNIAVVAPGPSLKNDIKWLKKNRKSLIVIAIHGAVTPLKKEGIIPDFQCALEIHRDSVLQDIYQLDPDLPLILPYLADEEVKCGVKNLLMVGIRERYNIVNIHCPVVFTLPSTGSFAVAFALSCNSAKIFLIGLDLGYRDKEKLHTKNSFYDNGDAKKYEEETLSRSESSLVAANFPENGPVWSKPFYTQARIGIEGAINYWKNKAKRDFKVINFSDGSRINGAEAVKSSTYGKITNKNCDRDKDLIIDSFKPAEEGLNWSYYDVSGADELEKFKKIILDEIKLDTFSFFKLAQAVDRAPLLGLHKSQETDPGNRMECYFRLVIDLLLTWYIFTLFCKDTEEGEYVYQAGRKNIEELVSSMKWPDV